MSIIRVLEPILAQKQFVSVTEAMLITLVFDGVSWDKLTESLTGKVKVKAIIILNRDRCYILEIHIGVCRLEPQIDDLYGGS